jgi:hypothetical protein
VALTLAATSWSGDVCVSDGIDKRTLLTGDRGTGPDARRRHEFDAIWVLWRSPCDHGSGRISACACDLAVDGRAAHREQLGQLGDRVVAGPGQTQDVDALASAELGLLAFERAVGTNDAIPSRVGIRNKSTSNSANIARMLKNIFPIGSVGS